MPAGTTSAAFETGVTVKVSAVQMDAALSAINGFALTVTVNSNVLLHWFGATPEVAVIVYTTLMAASVELVRV